MIKVASWNINSIRIRTDLLNRYIEDNAIDIICLQETKVIDDLFPLNDLILPYAVYKGEKSYNGVAILSRYPIDQVYYGLDDYDDEARVIEAIIQGISIVSVYATNGREVDHPEYYKKERFYKALAKKKRKSKQIFGGDFNIAPTDNDVYNPVLWKDRISCSLPERKWYKDFAHDLYDPMLNHHKQWTWWSYRAGCLHKDYGLRIDHFLMTKDIDILSVQVDKDFRLGKSSDHAPISCMIR